MSMEELFEKARLAMGATPEIRLAKARARTIAFNKKLIEQYRCSECGVDTLNYSHTFKCSYRGL
jgi:hypothetical protein